MKRERWKGRDEEGEMKRESVHFHLEVRSVPSSTAESSSSFMSRANSFKMASSRESSPSMYQALRLH